MRKRIDMTLHELKITPRYFDAVDNGVKRFEIRKNDRYYSVGDTLVMKEWDAYAKQFTGRTLEAVVTYILTSKDFPDGIKDGYCILGTKPI